MIKQHLMLALLGTAIVAAPALAQSQSDTTRSNSPAAQPSSPSGSSGSSAQTSSPSGSSGSSAQSSSPSGSTAGQSGSATSAQSGTMSGSGSFISQAEAGQWRASKLVGVDIYGSDNAKIGDVNEVLLDKNGNAQAVVIGVGGFLGVGAKDVAVAFNQVQWKDQPPPSTSSSTSAANRGTTGSGSGSAMTSSSSASGPKDYPDHGVVSMTKDQLKNAPEFKYASDTSSSSSSSGSSTTRPAPAAR